MRIQSVVRIAIAVLWLPVGTASAYAAIELGVVSTAPARPHFVAAGATTTFVISARNTGLIRQTISLRIQASSAGGWQARLSELDALFRPVDSGSDQLVVSVPALKSVRVLAQLAAGGSLPDAAEGTAQVTAWRQSVLTSSLELRARVRSRPKIYYVAVDGCGRRYLDLNRNGTVYDGTGDRLMPRASAFASAAARLSQASSVLPAVTDPNHTAALSGSWAGTSGLYSVAYQYLGEDAEGDPIMVKGSRDLLRWGPDGERVKTVFDVAKDPATGGATSTFNAFISGKVWLSDLFSDPVMDLVVDGKDYPDYLPAPHSYRLGDPASDGDADEDHEGTNAGPPGVRHRWAPVNQLFSAFPGEFPDDRWVAEATVRIIQAEDPDVLYVDLANSDRAQHLFGAADRPEEWIDPGTPGQLWDDENVYNPNANRDPVLDVIHEADGNFGLIADALDARQAVGRSFVVLLSDHSQVTSRSNLLNPAKILGDAGITEAEIERMSLRGDLGFVALTDPSKSARVESILEGFEVFDSLEGESVRPFIVVNREEMDSGIDGVEGPLAKDGIGGNRLGELYSEWSIDVPATGDEPKVRWPDLFIFMRNHYGNVLAATGLLSSTGSGTPLNGIHGSKSSAEAMLLMSGPGIKTGVYGGEVSLADIAPTLYRLLGVAPPGNVNGRSLDEILAH